MQSPLAGQRRPGLHRHRPASGTPVSLHALRGHYVFVNFFASWCIPCQEEAPDLSRFYYQQRTPPAAPTCVSVVFHDTTSTAESFLQHNGDLWPAVSDPGGPSPSATG